MGPAKRWPLIVLVGLASCASPSGLPSGSVEPSPAIANPTTGATCDPDTVPILVGPDGEQVVLGDGPGGTSTWTTNAFGMTAFLRQFGDCVWIIGYAPMEDRPDVPLLNAFHGRLGTDFRIVGTFSNNTGSLVPGYDEGELTYRVNFEGDEIVLIEDRSAGGPPACSGGEGICPPLLELRPSP